MSFLIKAANRIADKFGFVIVSKDDYDHLDAEYKSYKFIHNAWITMNELKVQSLQKILDTDRFTSDEIRTYQKVQLAIHREAETQYCSM